MAQVPSELNGVTIVELGQRWYYAADDGAGSEKSCVSFKVRSGTLWAVARGLSLKTPAIESRDDFKFGDVRA